ncbi:multidrug effflux MFS transporter [Camelliibacillus cellulosilyticus]|uniref:Bcr/CflA family efflux transporter n=1 Tax=Camelliibacillus cellulosilyticus TaxID=2174486 RepID=A0ABV9GL57_9BACL
MNPMTKQLETSAQKMSRSRRLWLALILGSLSAFGPLSIDMYLPALPELAKDLHTNASLAQLSLTACLLGLALGQLVVGPLSDARGRRWPLIVAVTLYAVSSILCAMSPSIWTLILLRLIQGVTGSAGIVISRAMVRDLYSGSELTKFFSLLMLVNGVAPILAPIIGGALLKVTDWHGVFIVLCLISVAMLLAAIFGLPETLPKSRRATGGIKNTLATFRSLVGDKVFMGYALSHGLVFCAMFAYISGSPFVLQNIYGVTPQGFSVFFAVNGLGIILATQITGRLAGRISERKLLGTGLGLAALGSILLLAAVLGQMGLIFLLLPLFIVVSCVGIVGTTSFALAMEKQGHAAGSASALLGLLPFIAGAVVAPLVGIGGSHTAAPMGIVILLADVGAVACFIGLTTGKKKAGKAPL